jgi:uncharacterized protein YjiS (DUF1127 family)
MTTDTRFITLDPPVPTVTQALRALTVAGLTVVVAVALKARYWAALSRSRSALALLDDRMLSDIGVERTKARIEAGKPFWLW